MHPIMLYEIAKIRVDELHREADRERLIRQAGRDRNRGVEWTGLVARLRTRLSGATRAQPRRADAGT